MFGGRSGTLWLPSHHPGGSYILEVDEEMPPDDVECFKCLEKAEKHYINVINYYYNCIRYGQLACFGRHYEC